MNRHTPSGAVLPHPRRDSMDFIEFVETDPGLPAYAIAMYERIDKQALKQGALLKIKDITSLRILAADPSLSPSLRAFNGTMADALERDPTGRLAAIPLLREWANRWGIGGTWINWYGIKLRAYLDAQKAPALVPMMVEA